MLQRLQLFNVHTSAANRKTQKIIFIAAIFLFFVRPFNDFTSSFSVFDFIKKANKLEDSNLMNIYHFINTNST